MARLTLDETGTSDGPSAWCMPIGHGYAHQGMVGTPMGPRDLGWIQQVAADPRSGIDFFSWWQEGLGAPYLLGRALCQMWTEVRWRAPLTDDETDETDLLVRVTGLLESAYRLDVSLAYPWREWHEILGYLGADTPLAAEVARRAGQTPDGPKVGYRRRKVAADLPCGWTIEVPGSLAEARDDDGTWRAWDLSRTLHCSTLSVSKAGRSPSAEEMLPQQPLPAEGEVLLHQRDGVVGRATIVRATDPNGDYWQMTARSTVPGAIALITICYEDPADRQWAVDTWQSLAHRPLQSP